MTMVDVKGPPIPGYVPVRFLGWACGGVVACSQIQLARKEVPEPRDRPGSAACARSGPHLPPLEVKLDPSGRGWRRQGMWVGFRGPKCDRLDGSARDGRIHAAGMAQRHGSRGHTSDGRLQGRCRNVHDAHGRSAVRWRVRVDSGGASLAGVARTGWARQARHSCECRGALHEVSSQVSAGSPCDALPSCRGHLVVPPRDAIGCAVLPGTPRRRPGSWAPESTGDA